MTNLGRGAILGAWITSLLLSMAWISTGSVMSAIYMVALTYAGALVFFITGALWVWFVAGRTIYDQQPD